ncbi:MAG: SulP family inorganic anion transporter [Gammaproteobacteria bacterium]|nr:SulP family inorganic anion transporter [Gammaproteobacteria bacterium]|tara:strand:+ start:16816 stop:18153 length:1338 start_codon:yes stop_codon:yes gene_type:complete
MLFNFSTWLPESLSSGNYVLRDIIAGTTIAMIIIPQSMAYAALADVPPVYGLYAALVPVGIAAFFGSSRYLATGPVAMVCLLTSVAVTSLSAGDASLYIFYAIILAVTVGVFQVTLALLRAGKVFDTIPEHVLLGFTSAAALIISTSQLSKVFGMPKISLGQLINPELLLASTPINFEALSLSILILFLMYLIKYKFTKFMTLSNLAVFFAVLLSISYSLAQSYSGPIVGYIPPGLPDFKIPDFNIFNGSIPMLIIHTLIIAFVGFMEAIAIAKQLYSKKPPKDSNGVELYKNPTPVDSNQELLGQGIANISSGISGSIPVSGSFSRSAVNEASGAYSGLSSIVTMTVVGITLLFATPLLFSLPQATLGIIVIFAVIPLIRIKEMSKLYSESKRLGTITWITFASTLIFPMLSIEIYEGVTTHIWTGIIFGFLIHILFSKKPTVN